MYSGVKQRESCLKSLLYSFIEQICLLFISYLPSLMPGPGDILGNKNRLGLCFYGAHSLVEKTNFNFLKSIPVNGNFKSERCHKGMGHRARETHTGEALTRPGGIREGSSEERMLGLRSGQKAGSGDSSAAVTASSDPVQERVPELADGTVMADTHRVIPPGIL